MAVPVVFIMISNHFPVATYGNKYSWEVLVVLVLLGLGGGEGDPGGVSFYRAELSANFVENPVRTTEITTRADTGHRPMPEARFLLAKIPASTRRTFLSPPMHECHREIARWMEPLGAQVRIDAAGNFRGVYPASQAERSAPADRFASRYRSQRRRLRRDSRSGACYRDARGVARAQTSFRY